MKPAKTFKTGDIAPVSGNYQFVRHVREVPDCLPRIGSYLHLRKGMKLPPHDECSQDCIWGLITVTEEENDPKIKGM